MSEQIDIKQQIKDALSTEDIKKLRRLFKEQEVADLAEVVSESEISESIFLLRMAPRVRRALLFANLDFECQEQLIEELPEVIISSLLNEMDPDDRTKILEQVSKETRHRVILQLDPSERKVAWKLLSYPEDSVGRLMTPDVLVLSSDMTVTQALESIHWNRNLPEEFLHYLFVTDEKGVLLGEVSLATLVMSDPPSQKLSQVMRKNFVALEPYQERSEAVEVFRKYDRNYIPVTNEEKKVIGIVTSDDVFDVAEEEATEDIQQFGGHSALEESYFSTPLVTMIKKRFGWLAILFICGFLSCRTLQSYEQILAQWSMLIVFLPIVTSAGGNSGTQAASLIIRGLAIKEMDLKDVWKILQKEIVIGAFLGLLLAGIGFLGVFSWGHSIMVGYTVAASVVMIVMVGTIIGSMLPFLFEKLNLDPAVVSSPFISTLLDVTGILIYINTALFMLKFSNQITWG